MTDDALVVAMAGLAQVPALAMVEASAFDEPWSADTIRGLLADGLSRAWVATESGDAVATALVRIVAGEGELLRIGVRPSHRRRGIGRRLIDAVKADVAGACPDGLHLEVRAANTAARRLYASAGFEQTGRRPGYYAVPPDDAILLRWMPIATSG